MNKIEQLEQQFLDIQTELEELKKQQLPDVEEEPVKAMLPRSGGWFLGEEHFDPEYLGFDIQIAADQNIFPDKETAEAYADAFRVMLELRRQAGSATIKDPSNEIAWIITRNGSAEEYYYTCDCFAMCPPFPSEDLARQAGEAVGIERIKRAYATLSNIKGE